jgi:hypothetical protein
MIACKLAGKTGFLGERRGSLKAAKREDGKNHPRQDFDELMG